MYLAYDNIPRELRDRLEGRTVLQVYDYNRYRIDPNVDMAGGPQPPATHLHHAPGHGQESALRKTAP